MKLTTYRKRPIAPRYTYSKQNADNFRSIFDGMTADDKDRFISSEGAKLSTLHAKITDALRWLSAEEGGKYATLKAKVLFHKMPSGVLIRRVTSKSKGGPLQVSKVSREDWTSDLHTWLASAQPDEIWERKLIIVTKAQQAWLEVLKDDYPEMEYTIDGATLRVIR